MVLLDEAGTRCATRCCGTTPARPRRPPTWSTSSAARRPGPTRPARAGGRFTVTKLRWLADHEPDVAARAAGVLLPHDWLTQRLRGGAGEPTTDRGDASGTGYWSAADGRLPPRPAARWRSAASSPCPGWPGPREAVGETPAGARAGARHRRQHGRRARPRARARRRGGLARHQRHRVRGRRAADRRPERASSPGSPTRPAGSCRWSCTLNAARVLGAGADDGRRRAGRPRPARAVASPDTGGLVLLPYLDGERTPDLPDATGLLHGLTRANATPANLARAAVEGMLCGLADAVDAAARPPASPRGARADRRGGPLGRGAADRAGLFGAAGRRAGARASTSRSAPPARRPGRCRRTSRRRAGSGRRPSCSPTRRPRTTTAGCGRPTPPCSPARSRCSPADPGQDSRAATCAAAATTSGPTTGPSSSPSVTMPTDASRPSTPRTGAATPRAPGCSSPVVSTYVDPPPAPAAEQDRLAGRALVQRVARPDPVGHVEVGPGRLDHRQRQRLLPSATVRCAVQPTSSASAGAPGRPGRAAPAAGRGRGAGRRARRAAGRAVAADQRRAARAWRPAGRRRCGSPRAGRPAR